MMFYTLEIVGMPVLRSILMLSAMCLCTLSSVHAATIGETPEIVYTGADAQALRDKATQLGNAVAIYEYVHNTIEFSPYHGSRSGSVNTFLGRRGSDVDIASTLIAMLRSQNIPARYAVATVRIPSAEVTNWLGIPNIDVAIQVLKDQGLQGVTLSSDRTMVDFEHSWAEAFMPFDQYRGINTVNPAIDCSLSANASRCTWIALDASFKQKIYNGLNLDPYNAVSFDYTAYYNAIKNNDPALRDKNPLTILEDQIGTWLRANHPGKTLEDVEDAGKIIELREGLLPASLPYKVIGNIRRYDTVADHDTAVVASIEPKKWGKTLRLIFNWQYILSNGSGLSIVGGSEPILLAALATKRLTISLENPGSRFAIRLGGTEVPSPLGSSVLLNNPPPIGTPFSFTVAMDGAPSISSGVADRSISATYSGIVGGYYLIATGGESSNWSQVHRAADQLLAANDQYKIVFKPNEAGCLADGINCTPYVDLTGNGWDAADTKLLETKPALDALTGGMLYVAAAEYYAKLREQIERSDRLMKIKTPILGFLGVVSSVYEAEYVDGTAFSILPGGLLIDMKGITFGGAYRANEPAVNYSSRQFEFISHIGSSLEHEIWQELTGYDAVSTVRGIQMALANGGSLINPKKNQSTDTVATLYSDTGFTNVVPSGFSATTPPLVIGTTAPATWTNAISGASFETLDSVIGINATSLQRIYGRYTYSTNSGLYIWSKCTFDLIEVLKKLPSTYFVPEEEWEVTCSGAPIYGNPSQMLTQTLNDWYNKIIPLRISQPQFDYFDRNKGFLTTNRMFRAYPPASDAIDTYTVMTMRNDMYVRDTTKSWVEFVTPTTLVKGSTYRFGVFIRKAYGVNPTGDKLGEITMAISNNGAVSGGGYIDLNHLDQFIDPLTAKKPLKNTPF